MVGCHTVDPREASGFSLEKFGDLALGDSKEAIVQSLGEPLSSPIFVAQVPDEILNYSQGGGTTIAGHQIVGRGYKCLVRIHDGYLDTAWITDESTGRECECSKDSGCEPGWADACFSSV